MAKKNDKSSEVGNENQEQNDQIKEEEETAAKQEDEEEKSFEELGLDPRLIRALNKKSINKPTPIQLVAIPLILVINSFLFSFLNMMFFSLLKSLNYK